MSTAPTATGVRGELFSDAELRLFAASNRNLKNRLIHAGSMCAGSLAFVGPLGSSLWFLASLLVALLAVSLARRADAEPSAERRRGLAQRLLTPQVTTQ